ncbi:hypothetical protein OMAG_000740 [Candidatus Omnitrophus magneticus]|uniref:Uncharacterized protein n=1 Tax=Candidatus Omnitrophus magneticus TaxID=1609969 RepID=A0A0F0CVF9_9BACT|nr:hypothetical protein OMAG_000740 [Candidatus Omnitrophus magneticus]
MCGFRGKIFLFFYFMVKYLYRKKGLLVVLLKGLFVIEYKLNPDFAIGHFS